MANTLKFGNGQWATGNGTALAYNDENSNFKPLPFDFTRASSGTTVNQSGLIETVGSGLPRIDFQGNTKGALLLEPSRTNLIPYSDRFNTPPFWTQVALTVSNNATISPDGTLNASKITRTSTSGNARLVHSSVAVSSGAKATLSAFFKYNDTDEIILFSPITLQGKRFSLQNATAGADFVSAPDGYGIENYGNGWYRFYIVVTAPSTSVDLTIYVQNNATTSIYLFGAQIEEGSYPTSYIPTSGSAVTRVADSCSQTVPSGVIGQTEGTLYAEIDFKSKPENGSPVVSIMTLNNDVNNLQNCIILGIERQSGGINRFYPFVQVSNSTVAFIIGGTLTDGNYKAAFAYKQNDFVLYVNGVQIGTDSSGAVPTTSQVLVGERFNNDAAKIADGIKDTKLYNTRLSNSELAALTQV